MWPKGVVVVTWPEMESGQGCGCACACACGWCTPDLISSHPWLAGKVKVVCRHASHRIASHRVWFECCDIEIYRPPASCFGFGFGWGLGLGLGLLLAVRWCAIQVVHRYVYNAPLIRSFRVCALNNSKTEHKKKHRNTSKHTEKYLIKIYVQPQKQSQRAIPPPNPPHSTSPKAPESDGCSRGNAFDDDTLQRPPSTSVDLQNPLGLSTWNFAFYRFASTLAEKSGKTA